MNTKAFFFHQKRVFSTMYRPDSSLVLRPSIGQHISHVQEKSAFFLEFIVLSCTFRKFSCAS